MLSVTRVKVSRKNQIAVPARARKALGIQPGDWLDVEVTGGQLVLKRGPRDALRELIEVAPEIWQGIDAEAYVRELRDEWSHRER
jgi:AbrB family looped-hinge helix DNA binding protein